VHFSRSGDQHGRNKPGRHREATEDVGSNQKRDRIDDAFQSPVFRALVRLPRRDQRDLEPLLHPRNSIRAVNAKDVHHEINDADGGPITDEAAEAVA
jgi:hypothetical protein